MTVGSFSVRAVTSDGHHLANVAAIASGPAAALSVVKRSMQGFPDGTRFFVRGGAPRREGDFNGARGDILAYDEAGSITEDQIAMLRDWGQIERFDEDPADARAEYDGDVKLALIAAGLIAGLAALQALRWLLTQPL